MLLLLEIYGDNHVRIESVSEILDGGDGNKFSALSKHVQFRIHKLDWRRDEDLLTSSYPQNRRYHEPFKLLPYSPFSYSSSILEST